MNLSLPCAAACLLAALPAAAQTQSMPGMNMPGKAMPADQPMQPDQPMQSDQPMHGMPPPTTLIETILQHSSSGTTLEPPSEPMRMWMGNVRGGWQLMLHGDAFLSDTQQHATTTPTMPSAAVCAEIGATCLQPNRRGADKLFSTNWIMPMAMHRVGRGGRITVRTMLDLEPATISSHQYPELFQQGETAFGKAIVDGQHPHDAVMELAVLYDQRLSEHTLLSLYAAPVGDPAIGPTAYPHRMSASEDPIAALGHHQEDSTHIAFNVFTAGLAYKTLRLEGSGFHGAEPDEARWHFQPSPNGLAVDSFSTRLTWVPTRDLQAQYSIAHITSPELLHPAENQQRQTASVMYNRPLGAHHDTTSMPGMDMSTAAHGNWSNTLLWGHTKSLTDNSTENSYLLESLLTLRRNSIYTRIESAGRSSELISSTPQPAEVPLGHVQAYTLGADRDYHLAPHVTVAPGAQFTLYRTPDPLAGTYGRTPFGAVAFLRFRIMDR